MKSCGSKSNTETGISKSTTSFERKYDLTLSTQVARAMNSLYLSTKKWSFNSHPPFFAKLPNLQCLSTDWAGPLHKDLLKLAPSCHIFVKSMQMAQNAKFGFSYQVFISACDTKMSIRNNTKENRQKSGKNVDMTTQKTRGSLGLGPTEVKRSL